MRILLLQNFAHVASGAGAGMFQDAAILREAGHEVRFLCTDRPPIHPAAAPDAAGFPPDLRYADLGPLGRVRHGLRPAWNRAAARAVARLLERARPDVVHDHGTAFHLTPAVLWACRRAGVPVVQTIHGAGLFCPAHGLRRGDGSPCGVASCVRGNPLPALLHRCLPGGAGHALATVAVHGLHELLGSYRRLDAWICASEAMAALARRAGLPAGRVHRVPYALPRAWLDRPPSAGPGRWLLFAGRLEREKGVHHLLAAMALLPRTVELLVAGRGAEEAALRADADRRGLTNVRFLGWQGEPALDALRRGALATVLPCDWFEAFGQVVLESFAAGRPVVASRTGGLPELVRDGVDGLLVEPGDPAALAAALRRLLEAPAEAEAMGRRARAEAERRFEPEAHLRALLEVYGAARRHAEGRA